MLVNVRPWELRDVYRCEQCCVGVPLARLSLSLPVSDSCGETGGKLALTSQWVRVSKCCSHHKRPLDDCGNKVAEKKYLKLCVTNWCSSRAAEIVLLNIRFSRPGVAGLVFWGRTHCLELQGKIEIRIESKATAAFSSLRFLFSSCVSLLMKSFFFPPQKTFLLCVLLNPHRWRFWVGRVLPNCTASCSTREPSSSDKHTELIFDGSSIILLPWKTETCTHSKVFLSFI